MAANKVIINGVTVIDLTGDTAEEADVRAGVTFHKRTGEPGVGTSAGGGAAVLQEKTATANGEVVPDAGFDGLSKVIIAIPVYNGEVL